MTSAIRKCLVELGAHEVVPRGRHRVYSTPEEAAAVKREQIAAAKLAQRDARRNAELAGLPPPSFERGRRRIYDTVEERRAAKRASDKLSKDRQTQRVIDAIRLLAAQSDGSVKGGGSSRDFPNGSPTPQR